MSKRCPSDAFEKLVGLWGTGPRAAVTVLGPVDFCGAQFARPVQFNGVKFSGSVSAAHAEFEAGLTFRDCRFDGGLDLAGAHIGGSLIFERCQFGLPRRAAATLTSPSLRLDHASVDGDVRINATMQGASSAVGVEVGGDVRFSGAEIGEFVGGNAPKAVNLDHARIRGSLLLDDHAPQGVSASFGEVASESASPARPRSHFRDNFSAECVTVGGDVSCEAVRIAGEFSLRNATARRVTCAGASVEKDFVADGLTVSEDIAIGPSAADDGDAVQITNISGALSFDGTTARTFYLAGVRIDGGLSAVGATCGSIFRLDRRCRIGRDLDLSLATIRGQLNLADIEAVERIQFNGTTCGSFLIAAEQGASVACNAIEAIDSTFSSYVRFRCLSVARKVPSELGERLGQISVGVKFESCTFKNGLALWRPEARDVHDQSKPTRVVTAFSDADLESRTRIKGSLRIVDCRVTGDLDLTGVQMEDAEAADPGSDDGEIALDRTTVTGALRFCSPASFAVRRDTVREARDNAVKIARKVQSLEGRPAESDRERQAWQAKARRLRIEGITATYVDLTGLYLPGSSTSGDKREVYAAGVAVTGTFQIYDEIPSASVLAPTSSSENANLFAHAFVPGSLNLEHATIGELVLSKYSFNRVGSRDAREDGIVLSDASIGRLRIPRRPSLQVQPATAGGDTRAPSDLEVDRGFPVPLDFEGTRIGSWSFEMEASGSRDDETDETAIADRYLDVLDNDVCLHRPIYRTISTQLRNAGHEEAANQVFRAEEYRATWSTRGKWKPGHGRNGARKQLGAEFFRVVGDSIFRRFLGYGTSALPLVKVIGCLALVTLVLVARDPRNFEVDDSVREVLAAGDPVGRRGYATCDDGAVLGPDPAKWGWSDALWLTARYHIPVIGLTARSDFKPTNERRITWTIGFRRPSVDHPLPIWWRPSRYTACSASDAPAARPLLPLLPDGWFNSMLILNWVLWPLLLTFLLRKLLRSD